MVFHFMGKYNGDPTSLPNQEHYPDAVPFREPSMNKTAIIGGGISIVLLALLAPTLFWRGGPEAFRLEGLILAAVCTVPHEFLHALLFRGDVYMYTMIRKGMLFVVGGEAMSKQRFILMSLLPNIVFGVIPFLLFLAVPRWTLLGTFGCMSFSFGAGDYMNVFNAIRQMPVGSKTYLYQTSSYWYMPHE